MFKHDPNEVVSWLEAMPKNDNSKGELSNEQVTVLQFMDECMDRFNRAQYRYTDQLAGLASQLSDIEVMSTSNAETASTGESILPFSPLLLTTLQHLKSFKGDKQYVKLYLSRLAASLLFRRKMPPLLQAFAKAQQQMDIIWGNKCDESSLKDTLDTVLASLQEYSLGCIKSSYFEDSNEEDGSSGMDLDAPSAKTLDMKLKDVAKYCISTSDLSACEELKSSLDVMSQVVQQMLVSAEADSSKVSCIYFGL